MIYLDSSVAIATVFGERRQPPDRLWDNLLVASRLLEYEIIVRINARGLGSAAVAAARRLLSGVQLIGLDERTLARALHPFPVPVRTLDALHLATMDLLRVEGATLELASYDERLSAAAEALGFMLAEV